MNINQLIAMLPIIVIAGTALAVMLIIAAKRNFGLACFLSAVGMLVSLSTVWTGLGKGPAQITLLMRIDDYGRFFIALFLLAGLAVIAFCYDYFKDREGENEEFLLLILIALFGGSILATSCHFASFFIGLETLSIPLFVLIGYSFEQSRSLEAAIKYLVLSGVSSGFLLMGMALIYAQNGSLDFIGIGHYVNSLKEFNLIIITGAVFIIAGLGFKLSLVPFHMWTPDVYEGAPAPVGGFVATVSKGAVFILLLRYFISADGYLYPALVSILSVIAVVTILTGNLLALLQQNVKRILAYSSISHMGYLLIAFIAGSTLAPTFVTESVTFYLIAYILTTLGAFGVVSLLATPQTEAGDLSYYQGLFWRRPWLATFMTIALLSLAGIPLTVGFIGKVYLFAAGIDAELWGLLITLIIGSGLGIYYYLRIIIVMSMSSDTKTADPDKSNQNWISYAALTLLTIFVVGFGIYPEYAMTFIPSSPPTIGDHGVFTMTAKVH